MIQYAGSSYYYDNVFIIITIIYLLVVPLDSDCCFSFSLLLLLVACFTRPDFSTSAFLLPARQNVYNQDVGFYLFVLMPYVPVNSFQSCRYIYCVGQVFFCLFV